ncbi:MAG: hypothetical protein IPN34_23125 [Planctomycetes bacterium]|nr:hypothetical protein [Planctomycetota bacterium]
MADDERVQLTISKDEVLVLFDWLSREEGGGELPARDAAEVIALWRLHGALEKGLTEPFLSSYAERLAMVRNRLTALHGSSDGGSASP